MNCRSGLKKSPIFVEIEGNLDTTPISTALFSSQAQRGPPESPLKIKISVFCAFYIDFYVLPGKSLSPQRRTHSWWLSRPSCGWPVWRWPNRKYPNIGNIVATYTGMAGSMCTLHRNPKNLKNILEKKHDGHRPLAESLMSCIFQNFMLEGWY